MTRFYVRKTFGKRRSNHAGPPLFTLNCEFAIPDGAMVGLAGASGSGKTTLLRALAGLEQPDEGFVEVQGVTWFNSAAGLSLSPQRRSVALVFQEYPLFPHMSLRKNLLFARNDREEASSFLELLGLEEHAEKRPAELSGGQRQRGSLAQSLMRSPKLLLLDEPFSALDEELRIQAADALTKVHAATGITIIIVSHDRRELEKLCSEVIELKAGSTINPDF